MADKGNTGIDALLEAAGAPPKGAAAGASAVSEKEEKKNHTAELQGTEAKAEDKDAQEEEVNPTVRTIEQIVEEEAKEDETRPASSFSLSRTLGGAIVAKAVQRQIGLLVLITIFLIIYITNRYLCQQQIVDIDKLEHKLTEVRYKATVCKSILTEKSRESNIMKMLEDKGDSTLVVPTTPPYKIETSK